MISAKSSYHPSCLATWGYRYVPPPEAVRRDWLHVLRHGVCGEVQGAADEDLQARLLHEVKSLERVSYCISLKELLFATLDPNCYLGLFHFPSQQVHQTTNNRARKTLGLRRSSRARARTDVHGKHYRTIKMLLKFEIQKRLANNEIFEL